MQCDDCELSINNLYNNDKITDSLKPLWYNFQNWKSINYDSNELLKKLDYYLSKYNSKNIKPIKFVELGRNRKSNENLNGQSRVYLSWDVIASDINNPLKLVVEKTFKNRKVKEDAVKIYKHIKRFNRIKKDIINYKSDNNNSIFFEWLPNTCNLNDIAITKKFKDDKLNIDLLKIFYRMVDTIIYLKEIGIAHRDIKPGNFLIKIERFFEFDNAFTSSDIIPVIIDFGFSTFNEDYINEPNMFVTDMKGTPLYAAPEVFDFDELEYCPFKADVWSLGLTLYKLKMGENLFHIKFNDNEIIYDSNYHKFIDSNLPDEDRFKSCLNSDIRDIILACCNYHPDKRISLYKLKELVANKIKKIYYEEHIIN